MTLFLNIALLVVGTAATLAAFGGETWRKGARPILQRITPRGWVSLLCLVLALCLGVIKEVHDEQKEVATKLQATTDKAAAEARQAELHAQLEAARGREELANQRLEDLKKLDEVTNDRLGETKTTLADVRKDLRSTRDDLSAQSAAALVSSLATSDQFVRAMWLYVPLTDKARLSSTFREALLPSFDHRECRDLLGLEVDIRTQQAQHEQVTYEPDDHARTHAYLKADVPKADSLLNVSGGRFSEQMEGVLRASGQKRINGIIYSLELHPTSDHRISASQLYATMTRPGVDIAVIQAIWPRTFKTKVDYENALKAYPILLKTDEDEDSLPDTDLDLRDDHSFKMPDYCSAAIGTYFKMAFESAVLVVALDQPRDGALKQSETIVFKLRSTIGISDDQVLANFELVSPPLFGAIEKLVLDQDPIKWPGVGK